MASPNIKSNGTRHMHCIFNYDRSVLIPCVGLLFISLLNFHINKSMGLISRQIVLTNVGIVNIDDSFCFEQIATLI